jgi:uncharacterized protein YcgI (DUF1989 family)
MYRSWHSPIRIVARPKLAGPGEHWGVQLPSGSVIHLTPEGVQLNGFDAFAAEKMVREVRQVDPGRHNEVMARVREALSNPPSYRLLDQNCEVFATWLVGEKPESPQVNGALLLGIVAALAMNA